MPRRESQAGGVAGLWRACEARGRFLAHRERALKLRRLLSVGAARRCGALGIGLLSGGYGSDELERAGALRVYDDPADMLAHLDEVPAGAWLAVVASD